MAYYYHTRQFYIIIHFPIFAPNNNNNIIITIIIINTYILSFPASFAKLPANVSQKLVVRCSIVRAIVDHFFNKLQSVGTILSEN